MKFLVVGLGSMGKRRVRNIQYLKAGEVIGFDTREDRCLEAEKKLGIETFTTFEEAMKKDPDALIISTPPHLHIGYALEAIKNDKHVFTEVNTVLPKELDKIIALTKNKEIVAAPSCTMRFHPCIKKMKEIVDKNYVGKILALTYHSGEYLPDWHPWEDYRSFYVGSRKTGGGRDQVVFELDWIRWIIGEVKAVSCFRGKLSKLDIDADDTYQILLNFKNGALASVLIDLIQRFANRYCKMISEEGLIIWDWSTRQVEIFTAKDKKLIRYPEREGYKGYLTTIEQMYADEINQFVKAIEGKAEYPHSFKDEKKVLEILYAAEKSSQTGAHVVL